MDLSQLLEFGCGVHMQGMMQKRVCMVLVRTHRFVMLWMEDGNGRHFIVQLNTSIFISGSSNRLETTHHSCQLEMMRI